MNRRFSTRIGLAALLAVGALVAVAAASAGSKAGAPVKLMVIAPVATPIQNYPDAQAGAQAAAAAINKKGGIKGRQIEISFCNTQSQANVAVGCARQAVEDKVVAVVGHISTLSTLEEPILQQANIPDVGFFSSGNPIDWTNPNMFPMVGGSVAAYLSLPFAMKKLGMKRFVITYQDVPSAATNAKLAKNAAKVAGLNVAGTVLLPGSTTDFAPYAQKLRELNPDSVMFINSPGVSGGLMRAATSLGVKPLFSHNTGSIGEAEAAQIGAPAEGMVLGGTAPTYRDTKYPGIRRFVTEMKAVGKDDPTLMKPVGVNAWLSVYAVAELAKSVKGNFDNVSLVAALRKQKKPINLFGLVAFSPGAKGPAAFPRWTNMKEYFEVVKNGQVVAYGPKLPPVEPLVLHHYVR